MGEVTVEQSQAEAVTTRYNHLKGDMFLAFLARFDFRDIDGYFCICIMPGYLGHCSNYYCSVHSTKFKVLDGSISRISGGAH